VKELEPVIRDEHDKPKPAGVDEKTEEDFNDIPFEIKRPGKEEDPNQMSLF
jgi:topoisomerase IV subunit A